MTTSEQTLYGGGTNRRVTVRDLEAATDRGEKWAMLTSYDMLTAAIFDEAGIPVLLVGDSAGNNVLGYDTTVPVTLDELLPLTRAVVRSTSRAMVVGDLPFGSYQASPAQALESALRLVKDGGAQAVKLEGGRRVVPQVELLTASGIAVMGHLGLTPQSVHGLGGYRVQGRGDAGNLLIEEALALQAAGAFGIGLEVTPADLAARVTKELRIPTIGIGGGPDTDAQGLGWTDMAGPPPPAGPQFLPRAPRPSADEARPGFSPAEEHGYS